MQLQKNIVGRLGVQDTATLRCVCKWPEDLFHFPLNIDQAEVDAVTSQYHKFLHFATALLETTFQRGNVRRRRDCYQAVHDVICATLDGEPGTFLYNNNSVHGDPTEDNVITTTALEEVQEPTMHEQNSKPDDEHQMIYTEGPFRLQISFSVPKGGDNKAVHCYLIEMDYVVSSKDVLEWFPPNMETQILRVFPERATSEDDPHIFSCHFSDPNFVLCQTMETLAYDVVRPLVILKQAIGTKDHQDMLLLSFGCVPWIDGLIKNIAWKVFRQYIPRLATSYVSI